MSVMEGQNHVSDGRIPGYKDRSMSMIEGSPWYKDRSMSVMEESPGTRTDPSFIRKYNSGLTSHVQREKQ